MLRSARAASALGAATVLIAIGVAACGGATPSTPPVSPASPLPSGTIVLEAKEYAFTPSTITAPAGVVTFSVRNAGNEAHEFEVLDGEPVAPKLDGLTPGVTKTVSITLAAGEYAFACRLNGHDQIGMKGTLTVE